jgi:hypothetical protein
MFVQLPGIPRQEKHNQTLLLVGATDNLLLTLMLLQILKQPPRQRVIDLLEMFCSAARNTKAEKHNHTPLLVGVTDNLLFS